MKEIWKEIENYETIYEVSNFGKIKSVKRNTILIPNKLISGFYQVKLSKRGDKRCFLVSHLVYETFAMKLNKENVISYRDRDPSNYSLDNLIVFENHSKLKSYLLLASIP